MVVVAGAALTPFNRRKDKSNFRDWAEDAFVAALADAGLEPGDIDALVVASESDFFTLQLNPASVIADDLGLAGAAAMRVEGGGASGQLAVHAGVQQILSGTASCVAVVGVEPSASQLPAAAVTGLYGYSFDFWTDGMTGSSATALYALSARFFMARTGATVEDFAAVAVRNRQNARDNPNAHLPLDTTVADVLTSPVVSQPYRRLDCSPLSDGAAAVILTALDAKSTSPRIRGIGAATDRVNLGARDDPGNFAGKTKAAQRAFSMAGISPSDVDVAEIYDSYSGAQLQAIEALGLSDGVLAEHRAGAFDPDGRLPVNLSGGLLGQGAPVGAVGVGQVATCALLLQGRYPGVAPAHAPRTALADTHGGVATTCAVTLLQAGD
jgi:acetyl-CoA C-acetyltransferase